MNAAMERDEAGLLELQTHPLHQRASEQEGQGETSREPSKNHMLSVAMGTAAAIDPDTAIAVEYVFQSLNALKGMA